MKEYDLFVPLNYNDGSPVEQEKLSDLRETLLTRFDGLTYFPQANEGYWKMGDVTYKDEIVIFRVLCSDDISVRQFFEQLKEQLKEDLEQEEILIVERDADVI